MKSVVMLGMTALAVVLVQGASSAARADNQGPAAQGPVTQTPAAISGQVTSQAEGAMEGVVVTAHKDGSIVSVSVTSDAKGHYAFPENRLEPGHYTLAIRAVGYDLSAPASTDVVAEKTASVDLKLDKTKNLATQLTNAEWMMSIPGTEEQKAFLLNCTSCHTLERIVRSTHNVDELTQVVTRMRGYGAVSQPVKPQRMLDRSRAGTPEQYRKLAEYLATINLSAVDQWHYELKTLPRPTGRATHAIVTEYDMPTAPTEPHDVLVDEDGNVWYSDFGEIFISQFDPKTLKLTEYPVKTVQARRAGRHSLARASTRRANSGSTPCTRARSAISIPRPARSPIIRWRRNTTTTGCSSTSSACATTSTARYGPRASAPRTSSALDLASGKWESFHPTEELPPGRRYASTR